MKGDFTRSTFEPRRRYSGVRMQQGRVQLDADWNEQVDIDAHLRETALADVIGPCGVPKEENGGGYAVEIADGGANLTFSAGRIYVDGILCENDATRRLTEQDEDHPELALPGEDGTWFVYLDVWQRHVTALEDPAIREVALGGPDTATRTRTTCQVKMVRVPDGSECPDDPQEWLDAVAAPTGRMRARTRPADFDPNPCVVPPSAGFTGGENQLYRVEVHQGGELGGAGPQPTFKWSRDNGSVVSRWLATDGSDVTVDSLGRDSVLTLEGARWVELTDDLDELGIRPGQLAEVSGVGDDMLTVAPAPGAPDLARNAKVRRWDMPGAGGAVPIAEAPDDDSWTDLESGIQVDFAPGTYRTGDHWLIPARAFIGEHAGDIEWPAPGGAPAALLPDGVEHHHCKLAVVERSNGAFTSVIDCREPFCPLTELGPGCCTVVVQPGEDVQAAIDSLPPEGGCVCLKTGEHPVGRPIRIEGSNVTLHGESPGAVVRGEDTFELLRVGRLGARIEEVMVEGIHFRPGRVERPAGLPAVIAVVGAEDTALRHCRVGEDEVLAAGVAVAIGGCERIAVEGCTLAGPAVGIHVFADSTALAIRGNRVLGASGRRIRGDQGSVGIWLEDAYDASWVEGNLVAGFQVGIALDRDLLGMPSSGAAGSVVAGNHVRRTAPPGGDEGEDRVWAIDVAARSCRVEDNVLVHGAPSYCGIRVSGDGTAVIGNRVSSLLRGAESFQSVAIQVGWEDPSVPGFGDRATVEANRVEGLQDGIWVVGCSQPAVLYNRFGGADDRLRTGIFLLAVEGGRVAGNEVHAELAAALRGGGGNLLADNRADGGFAGLAAVDEADLTITGNVVENSRGPAITGAGLDGATVVSGNRLVSCAHAPARLPPFSLMIFSLDPVGSVQVESNVVLESGIAVDGETAIGNGSGIGVIARAVTVHANRVAYERLASLRGAEEEGRALFLAGLPRLEGMLNDNLPIDIFQAPAPALVTDNSFHGTGRSALVEVLHVTIQRGNLQLDMGFGEVTFSSNHCLHFHPGTDANDQRTVALGGRRIVVVGNHVRSARLLRSFDFIPAAQVVYTGNFTTGGTRNADNFPSPENGHNRP